MKNLTTLLGILVCAHVAFGQDGREQESSFPSKLESATLFYQGAQLQHTTSCNLRSGKQIVVFEKLSDFIDPNSIQVKAGGNLTILSVRMRKNFEDKRISNESIQALNKKIKALDRTEKKLRDENEILQIDRSILNKNSSLKGSSTGLKVADLKEAYSFIHARMIEISKRENEIFERLENIVKDKNKLLQEIKVQRSKPIVNYSEILVEVDVRQAGNVDFKFNYITPSAKWKAYYDLRSSGIGSQVSLEAKALVEQNTGIDWKGIDLVLSTNDPYQNANEKELLPWKLDYNRAPYIQNSVSRPKHVYDYAGQTIRGEVIDAQTGESMPFTKLYFNGNKAVTAMTNSEGKFEINVPKGERYLYASFVGYKSRHMHINAPYLKFFMISKGVRLAKNKWRNESGRAVEMDAASGYYDMKSESIEKAYAVDAISPKNISVKGRRSSNGRRKKDKGKRTAYNSEALVVEQVKKDLRVEYKIQSKFTITGDGKEQRVSIAQHELPASYEYHTAPKIDPSVFLVAEVSGWEKLNLLNGESNVYFDGTYIGKSYLDVESTKDTLTLSLGKDSKIQTERKRIVEKSKSKSIGSRQRYDIAWEIVLKNNGGAQIPLILKDQFPVSVNTDIKVKIGDYKEGSLNNKTGILTWKMALNQGESKKLQFNYSVDYQKGARIYLE